MTGSGGIIRVRIYELIVTPKVIIKGQSIRVSWRTSQPRLQRGLFLTVGDSSEPLEEGGSGDLIFAHEQLEKYNRAGNSTLEVTLCTTRETDSEAAKTADAKKQETVEIIPLRRVLTLAITYLVALISIWSVCLTYFGDSVVLEDDRFLNVMASLMPELPLLFTLVMALMLLPLLDLAVGGRLWIRHGSWILRRRGTTALVCVVVSAFAVGWVLPISLLCERVYVISAVEEAVTVWETDESQGETKHKRSVFSVADRVTRVVLRRRTVARLEQGFAVVDAADYVVEPGKASIYFSEVAGAAKSGTSASERLTWFGRLAGLLTTRRVHINCTHNIRHRARALAPISEQLEFEVAGDLRPVLRRDEQLILPLSECKPHKVSLEVKGQDLATRQRGAIEPPPDGDPRDSEVEDPLLRSAAFEVIAVETSAMLDLLTTPGVSDGSVVHFDHVTELEAFGDPLELEWDFVEVDFPPTTSEHELSFYFDLVGPPRQCRKECVELSCPGTSCLVPVGFEHDPLRRRGLALSFEDGASGFQAERIWEKDELLGGAPLRVKPYSMCATSELSVGTEIVLRPRGKAMRCAGALSGAQDDSRIFYCWEFPEGQDFDIDLFGERHRGVLRGGVINLKEDERRYAVTVNYVGPGWEVPYVAVKIVAGELLRRSEDKCRVFAFSGDDEGEEGVVDIRISEAVLREQGIEGWSIWAHREDELNDLRHFSKCKISNPSWQETRELEFECKK